MAISKVRCSAALFLAPHDVIPKQKRDGQGVVVSPHVLQWECLRCGRIVGETAAPVLRLRAGTRAPPRPVILPRRRLHAITEFRRKDV